jgi:hypothetical protein
MRIVGVGGEFSASATRRTAREAPALDAPETESRALITI